MQNRRLEEGVRWQKVRCESEGCPQVARLNDGIALGDTKRPNEGFVFSEQDFSTLIIAIKRGELDYLIDKSSESK